jgi:hypothetical protein
MYFKMDRTCINHRSRFLSWSFEQIYFKTSLKGSHLFLTLTYLEHTKNLIDCCNFYEEFNILLDLILGQCLNKMYRPKLPCTKLLYTRNPHIELQPPMAIHIKFTYTKCPHTKVLYKHMLLWHSNTPNAHI